MNPKRVDQLNDNELREIAREGGERARVVRSVLKEGLARIDREMNRINTELSDFTQRDAALMTIAGLLALLPLPQSGDNLNLVRHFFVWVYPFLAIAIVGFFWGSVRMHANAAQLAIGAEGTEEELLILKGETTVAQNIWRTLNKTYERALGAHRVISTSILLYLIAFALHYGLFLFISIPDFYVSLQITVALILIGFLINYRNSRKSRTESWNGLNPGSPIVEKKIMFGSTRAPKTESNI